MHISMNQIIRMQVLQRSNHLLKDIDNFHIVEFALAKCLPLGNYVGQLHLNEYQILLDDPELVDFNQVSVFEFAHQGYGMDSFATLLLVQSRNVDAGDHALDLGL